MALVSIWGDVHFSRSPLLCAHSYEILLTCLSRHCLWRKILSRCCGWSVKSDRSYLNKQPKDCLWSRKKHMQSLFSICGMFLGQKLRRCGKVRTVCRDNFLIDRKMKSQAWRCEQSFSCKSIWEARYLRGIPAISLELPSCKSLLLTSLISSRVITI